MPINKPGASPQIPITKPFLGEEEAAAAREVILSGWVTQGPKVREFEERFAEYVGAQYACAVSSCTTALHLALLGVEVKPGEVVITVSHSFIATANAIRHCGAEPVFVDIDPQTYNMDVAELRKCLEHDCERRGEEVYYREVQKLCTGESPLGFVDPSRENFGRVAAILPVHQMGMPCEINQIVQLAQQYHLPVVEDAACAIGSEISSDGGTTWEKIGKPHGEAACFSFHPRKVLTTGDGGMITTNNPELDAKFRLWRQHGMSVSDAARHKAGKVIIEEYLTTGFNYRLTDIQAAVGIEQLKKIEAMVRERQALADAYAELFQEMPAIMPSQEPSFAKTNWQSYPVRLRGISSATQINIMQALQDKGIAVRRGIMNAHQEQAYGNTAWNLPQSEACRDETILLPLYCGLENETQRFIRDALVEALAP